MKTKHIIAAAVVLLFPIVAGAQVLKGSYFLDNSINRHKMNPAFAPRANYFQLPAIGNLGFGVYSNLSVPTFMYPVDGKLGTFLHPSVSVEQFRKDMPKHPIISHIYAGENFLRTGCSSTAVRPKVTVRATVMCDRLSVCRRFPA